MRFLLAVALCFVASGASAQNGAKAGPTAIPVAADYAQLPFSVLLPLAPPVGWNSTSQMWLTAIWDRRAAGAWYRNPQWPNWGRSAAAYMDTTPNMGTTAFSCTAEAGFKFRCRDRLRGVHRTFACPATANFGQPIQWRSLYKEWPLSQDGWYFWRAPEQAKWQPALDARNFVKLRAHFVQDGKKLACQYDWPAIVDVWVFVR